MMVRSGTPLALAVRVYCIATSSSICARTERMMPQVPLVPITRMGMIILFKNSPKLYRWMPFWSISWENRPTFAFPVHL